MRAVATLQSFLLVCKNYLIEGNVMSCFKPGKKIIGFLSGMTPIQEMPIFFLSFFFFSIVMVTHPRHSGFAWSKHSGVGVLASHGREKISFFYQLLSNTLAA